MSQELETDYQRSSTDEGSSDEEGPACGYCYGCRKNRGWCTHDGVPVRDDAAEAEVVAAVQAAAAATATTAVADGSRPAGDSCTFSPILVLGCIIRVLLVDEVDRRAFNGFLSAFEFLSEFSPSIADAAGAKEAVVGGSVPDAGEAARSCDGSNAGASPKRAKGAAAADGSNAGGSAGPGDCLRRRRRRRPTTHRPSLAQLIFAFCRSQVSIATVAMATTARGVATAGAATALEVAACRAGTARLATAAGPRAVWGRDYDWSQKATASIQRKLAWG